MDGSVVRITHERSCEIRLSNDILVVFREPAGHSLCIGDVVSFSEFRLEGDVSAENKTRGDRFTVRIRPDNVHDLRLPARHGSSRTPSASRLVAE
jgi:hypothetical protein